MERRIRINNLKNLTNIETSVPPLLIVEGSSGSGKSAFLQAIRLVLDKRDVDFGKMPAALAFLSPTGEWDVSYFKDSDRTSFISLTSGKIMYSKKNTERDTTSLWDDLLSIREESANKVFKKIVSYVGSYDELLDAVDVEYAKVRRLNAELKDLRSVSKNIPEIIEENIVHNTIRELEKDYEGVRNRYNEAKRIEAMVSEKKALEVELTQIQSELQQINKLDILLSKHDFLCPYAEKPCPHYKKPKNVNSDNIDNLYHLSERENEIKAILRTIELPQDYALYNSSSLEITMAEIQEALFEWREKRKRLNDWISVTNRIKEIQNKIERQKVAYETVKKDLEKAKKTLLDFSYKVSSVLSEILEGTEFIVNFTTKIPVIGVSRHGRFIHFKALSGGEKMAVLFSLWYVLHKDTDIALIEGAELDDTIRRKIVEVAKENKDGAIILTTHECKEEVPEKLSLDKSVKEDV